MSRVAWNAWQWGPADSISRSRAVPNAGSRRLGTFILRRVLQAALVSWGVVTVTFALAQLIPGDFTNRLGSDPNVTAEMIAAMRHRFGLDRPWLVQYALYLK